MCAHIMNQSIILIIDKNKSVKQDFQKFMKLEINNNFKTTRAFLVAFKAKNLKLK